MSDYLNSSIRVCALFFELSTAVSRLHARTNHVHHPILYGTNRKSYCTDWIASYRQPLCGSVNDHYDSRFNTCVRRYWQKRELCAMCSFRGCAQGNGRIWEQMAF